MHTPVRKSVLIHHNGQRTSHKRAAEYVRKGDAEFIAENVIRFHRASIRGYDKASSTGHATAKELRGVPFVGNIARMC